jgi:hypothetical protein
MDKEELMNPDPNAVHAVVEHAAVGHAAAYLIALAALAAIGFLLFFWRRRRARMFAQQVK